jgi:hypothetical protein
MLKQFMSSAYLPRPERKNGVTLINLANGTFEITPASAEMLVSNGGRFARALSRNAT